MTTRKNFFPRVDKRKAEAKERQAKWDKLTDAQKLQSLESRGHGHCKQSRRLNNNKTP